MERWGSWEKLVKRIRREGKGREEKDALEVEGKQEVFVRTGG
jgi:hypothetical protein